MKRLRSYGPLARQSKKVKKAEPDFRAVYRLVDLRSEGRCEFDQLAEWGPRLRCTHTATDHHHVLKPRRVHHNENAVVHLCRHHHDRAEWPYPRGRLVVTILGNGRFEFAIKFASDKFAAREEV